MQATAAVICGNSCTHSTPCFAWTKDQPYDESCRTGNLFVLYEGAESAMMTCRPISKLVEKALEGAETIRTLHARLHRRYGDETFLGPAGVDLSRDLVDLARIISNLETMRSNLSQSV